MEKLYIIKIGGNIIDDPSSLSDFLPAFSALKGPKILVHGGGKIASETGRKMGIEPLMHEGRRITDAPSLDLVTMVYAGLINSQLIAQLRALGTLALGINGADFAGISASRRPVKDVDFGFVGDVSPDGISVANIRLLLDAGITPVYSPITCDPAGQLLNTNADTIASSLAVALAQGYEVSLVYCFEKKGVLSDVHDEDSLIPEISFSAYHLLKEASVISAGMLPKLENAFGAIAKGVSEVLILHASEIAKIADNENYTGTRLVS